MANTYFSFKQFTVYHDKCAMKVGTDGVLLGAWTRLREARQALDVGTGTGLIAMMLYQRSANNLSIDAIDIDYSAVQQAQENVDRALFGGIQSIWVSLQDLAPICGKKYDLIVSNPPYFSASLHSPDNQRTLARHTHSLPMNEFMFVSAQLLSPSGYVSLIYPHTEKDTLVGWAKEAGLFVSRITYVYPTPHSEPKRILLEFSLSEQPIEETHLIIEKLRHQYTDDFIDLVKDFYLKL